MNTVMGFSGKRICELFFLDFTCLGADILGVLGGKFTSSGSGTRPQAHIMDTSWHTYSKPDRCF